MTHGIKDKVGIFHTMMHKCVAVCCLFFIISCSYAQTIVKSYPDKVASRFSDYEIIGKNNMGVIVHYFGNNESELVTYDDKLRIANRRELPFKGKGITLESFVLLQDKILVFYTSNSSDYQYFNLNIIDDKLNIAPTSLVIDSMPQANIGNGKAFYVKTSPDKSKLLTFSIVKTKTNYFVKFSVFSDSIKRISRNVFTMTNVNDVALRSIKVNNEGNVLAVVGDENGYATNDYNYDKYTIFTYNKSTNTIGELPLQQPDYIFKNLISEVSNKRDILYLVASYKSTKNKNDIGLYYQIIDFRTNNILLSKPVPFTPEILQKSQTSEFKTWQDKATLIKPKRIIPRSDGGLILITEGEYKVTRTERMPVNNYGYYNSGPYMPSVRYVDQNHYYDINVFSINTDGTLDWQTDMPKAQVSENDDGYYSSFAFFEANNVLKFLFNEDFYNNGNFVEYNVNPNGLAKRQSVMNSEKQDLVMVPLKAKQLDGNTIIFPSEQKRTLQFVLFQY